MFGIPSEAGIFRNNSRIFGGVRIMSMFWLHAEGREKGQSVKPLFKSVPKAAFDNECLYEYLALADAVRIGGPREANLVAEMLRQRLFSDGWEF